MIRLFVATGRNSFRVHLSHFSFWNILNNKPPITTPQSTLSTGDDMIRHVPVSYTHLTLPTN